MLCCMHVYAHFVNVIIIFFVNYRIPDKYVISCIMQLYKPKNCLSVPDKTMRPFHSLIRKVECTISTQ